MADEVGQQDIWGTRFSEIVTGFAYEEFKLKQVVKVVSSSDWSEKFYRETSAELTGGLGSAVEGVPRLANFPHANPSWTLVTATQKKFGMESSISWEDVATNQFDTISRVLLKVARAVASSVDLDIYQTLSAGAGNTTASSAAWAVTGASGAPPEDILKAIRLIAEDGYDAHQKGFLLLNPLNYTSLLTHIFVKGAQAPALGTTVLGNGRVGTILGLTIIVSNNVTADECMVVIGQECATWQSAAGLQVATIVAPGIDYTVRAWEVGVLQLTNPNAVCTITNTDT